LTSDRNYPAPLRRSRSSSRASYVAARVDARRATRADQRHAPQGATSAKNAAPPRPGSLGRALKRQTRPRDGTSKP
jgi:hypothetical protein